MMIDADRVAALEDNVAAISEVIDYLETEALRRGAALMDKQVVRATKDIVDAVILAPDNVIGVLALADVLAAMAVSYEEWFKVDPPIFIAAFGRLSSNRAQQLMLAQAENNAKKE